MKPARFAHHAATSVADALAALARHEGARPIAGGQSLGPMLNMRVAQPAMLVDLDGIPDLAGIRREGEVIRVGAMVRQHDLARDPEIARAVPLLAAGAATIGHYVTRRRGTVGGSLVHADPAAQLPSLAVALAAEFEIAGPSGSRRVPAGAFFRATFETAVGPNEILVATRWPAARPGEGWGFRLVQRRPGDYAVALAAIRLSPEGALTGALGGVAATPMPLAFSPRTREDPGEDPDWPAALARAATAALDVDDAPTVPAAYRREVAAVVVEAACRDALRRLGLESGTERETEGT